MKVPHNLQLEQVYLGTILRGDGIRFFLEVDAFYNEENKKAYRYLLDLQNENIKIDIVSAFAKFQTEGLNFPTKKIIEYVESIPFTNDPQLSSYRSLKRLRNRRKAIVIADKLMKGVESEDDNEHIHIAMSDLSSLYNDTSEDTCFTTDSFYEEYAERITKMKSGEKFGYSTGIPVIDKNCDGGIQLGTVTRLAAQSNIGKTRVLIWIMANILKQGIKCAFFSTEVRSEHFFPIFASAVTGEKNSDIKYGNCDLNWDEINKLPFLFYHDKFKLKDMFAMAKKHGVKVMFIDFAQNIDAGFLGDEYKNMSHYSREVQLFAIENNIAVFDVSQISNESVKPGSDSKFISGKGSGGLYYSADVFLLMTRNAFDKKTTELEFDIRKNKYGSLDSCGIIADFNASKFVFVPSFNKQ